MTTIGGYKPPEDQFKQFKAQLPQLSEPKTFACLVVGDDGVIKEEGVWTYFKEKIQGFLGYIGLGFIDHTNKTRVEMRVMQFVAYGAQNHSIDPEEIEKIKSLAKRIGLNPEKEKSVESHQELNHLIEVIEPKPEEKVGDEEKEKEKEEIKAPEENFDELMEKFVKDHEKELDQVHAPWLYQNLQNEAQDSEKAVKEEEKEKQNEADVGAGQEEAQGRGTATGEEQKPPQKEAIQPPPVVKPADPSSLHIPDSPAAKQAQAVKVPVVDASSLDATQEKGKEKELVLNKILRDLDNPEYIAEHRKVLGIIDPQDDTRAEFQLLTGTSYDNQNLDPVKRFVYKFLDHLKPDNYKQGKLEQNLVTLKELDFIHQYSLLMAAYRLTALQGATDFNNQLKSVIRESLVQLTESNPEAFQEVKKLKFDTTNVSNEFVSQLKPVKQVPVVPTDAEPAEESESAFLTTLKIVGAFAGALLFAGAAYQMSQGVGSSNPPEGGDIPPQTPLNTTTSNALNTTLPAGQPFGPEVFPGFFDVIPGPYKPNLESRVTETFTSSYDYAQNTTEGKAPAQSELFRDAAKKPDVTGSPFVTPPSPVKIPQPTTPPRLLFGNICFEGDEEFFSKAEKTFYPQQDIGFDTQEASDHPLRVPVRVNVTSEPTSPNPDFTGFTFNASAEPKGPPAPPSTDEGVSNAQNTASTQAAEGIDAHEPEIMSSPSPSPSQTPVEEATRLPTPQTTPVPTANEAKISSTEAEVTPPSTTPLNSEANAELAQVQETPPPSPEVVDKVPEKASKAGLSGTTIGVLGLLGIGALAQIGSLLAGRKKQKPAVADDKGNVTAVGSTATGKGKGKSRRKKKKQVQGNQQYRPVEDLKAREKRLAREREDKRIREQEAAEAIEEAARKERFENPRTMYEFFVATPKNSIELTFTQSHPGALYNFNAPKPYHRNVLSLVGLRNRHLEEPQVVEIIPNTPFSIRIPSKESLTFEDQGPLHLCNFSIQISKKYLIVFDGTKEEESNFTVYKLPRKCPTDENILKEINKAQGYFNHELTFTFDNRGNLEVEAKKLPTPKSVSRSDEKEKDYSSSSVEEGYSSDEEVLKEEVPFTEKEEEIPFTEVETETAKTKSASPVQGEAEQASEGKEKEELAPPTRVEEQPPETKAESPAVTPSSVGGIAPPRPKDKPKAQPLKDDKGKDKEKEAEKPTPKPGLSVGETIVAEFKKRKSEASFLHIDPKEEEEIREKARQEKIKDAPIAAFLIADKIKEKRSKGFELIGDDLIDMNLKIAQKILDKGTEEGVLSAYIPHALPYLQQVMDSTPTETNELKRTLAVYQAAICHLELGDKPNIVLGNALLNGLMTNCKNPAILMKIGKDLENLKSNDVFSGLVFRNSRFAEPMVWYRQAALLGHIPAFQYLTIGYQNCKIDLVAEFGDMVPRPKTNPEAIDESTLSKDAEELANWREKLKESSRKLAVCCSRLILDSSNSNAIFEMGYLYEQYFSNSTQQFTSEVQDDGQYDVARTFYERAAQLGHTRAQARLAAMHILGLGGDIDVVKGQELISDLKEKAKTHEATNDALCELGKILCTVKFYSRLDLAGIDLGLMGTECLQAAADNGSEEAKEILNSEAFRPLPTIPKELTFSPEINNIDLSGGVFLDDYRAPPPVPPRLDQPNFPLMPMSDSQLMTASLSINEEVWNKQAENPRSILNKSAMGRSLGKSMLGRSLIGKQSLKMGKSLGTSLMGRSFKFPNASSIPAGSSLLLASQTFNMGDTPAAPPPPPPPGPTTLPPIFEIKIDASVLRTAQPKDKEKEERNEVFTVLAKELGKRRMEDSVGMEESLDEAWGTGSVFKASKQVSIDMNDDEEENLSSTQEHDAEYFEVQSKELTTKVASFVERQENLENRFDRGEKTRIKAEFDKLKARAANEALELTNALQGLLFWTVYTPRPELILDEVEPANNLELEKQHGEQVQQYEEQIKQFEEQIVTSRAALDEYYKFLAAPTEYIYKEEDIDRIPTETYKSSKSFSDLENTVSNLRNYLDALKEAIRSTNSEEPGTNEAINASSKTVELTNKVLELVKTTLKDLGGFAEVQTNAENELKKLNKQFKGKVDALNKQYKARLAIQQINALQTKLGELFKDFDQAILEAYKAAHQANPRNEAPTANSAKAMANKMDNNIKGMEDAQKRFEAAAAAAASEGGDEEENWDDEDYSEFN